MKAGSSLDAERAAMVLCDALFYGDAKATERAGITTRTLRRYRQRMASDPELSAIVRLKKDELCSRWADDLAVGIRSACDFIRRACAEGDTKNPDMLRAVNGSLKIMADAHLAERLVAMNERDATLAEVMLHIDRTGKLPSKDEGEAAPWQ